MTDPGWYNAEGDPPGTTRYWDGEQWVGDPVSTPAASPGGHSAGGYSAGGTSRYALASTGARFGARLIDLVIMMVIGAVILASVISEFIDGIDALGPNPSNSQVEQVLTRAFETNSGTVIVFTLVLLTWDFLWVGLLGGTPGKLMLGLRVARADTGVNPPGWGKAALRSLNRLLFFVPAIGQLASLLVGLASLIMLFVDDQHRTVMDRVASTVVVKK